MVIISHLSSQDERNVVHQLVLPVVNDYSAEYRCRSIEEKSNIQ